MNNNQIQIFSNQTFGKLTVIEKNGEFFFIGKEVAEKLGYLNPQKAIRDHIEDEDKLTERFVQSGQGRNMYIINESGLYSLILSSKLPQAKEFKRWVTKEVLPSIRKHGGYIRNQETKSNEEILASAVLLAERLMYEKDRKIDELKPKAQYFDKLVDKNLLMNIRNTAKELHIPQKKFVNFLLDNGFLYRDKRNRLLPYADKNKGYFEVKEWFNNKNDMVGFQTFITPKGRSFLLFLIGGGAKGD